DKFPVLRLTSKSKEVLSGSTTVYHKKDLIEKLSTRKSVQSDIDIPESFNEDLFLELRELRYRLSQEKELAPFMIFHDSSLREMAFYFPQDRESLLAIKGVGLKKYESYGEDFISVIKNFVEEHDLESIPIPTRVTPTSPTRENVGDC